MAEVASAFVSLMPSARGWSSAVEKEVGPDLDRAGKQGGSRFGKAAAAGIAAGLAGAAAGVKALYNLGATFDDVTDTIRVGTGATGEALAGLSDSAKRIATEIPTSFEEAGQTVADLNTRLGVTGPTLEKLAEQFLEAGRMTGEAIDVNTMTKAFNAYGVEGRATTKVMDDIYRVSQATGIGMNELASQVARNAPVMKQFGFTASDAAALMGTLDKAGLDGNRTMATLSRAMVEFAEEGRDPQKALSDTVTQIEAFTKAGDDAAAVNLAAEIFGTRGASQFVAAVKDGKVNLEDLMGATGATGDTILKASEDTQDFAEKWQTFKNRVLVGLEPIATKVFDAFGKGADRVFPAVEKFIDEMKSGEGVGGAFADVMKTAGGVLKTVAGFLLDNKEAVAAFLGVMAGYTIINKAVGAFKVLNIVMRANPIGLVVTAIALLVAGLVTAYKKSETFRKVVDKAFDAVGAAARWLWNNALQPTIKFILQGFAWVTDAIASMLDALGNIPGFGWAKDAADKMRGAADKARELADGIRKIPDRKSVTVTFNEVTVRSIQTRNANDRRLDGQLASGGPVRAGGLYLVGEEGPELFSPNTSGRIIPNASIDPTVGAAAGGRSRVQLVVGGRAFDAYLEEIADSRVSGAATFAGTRARAGMRD